MWDNCPRSDMEDIRRRYFEMDRWDKFEMEDSIRCRRFEREDIRRRRWPDMWDNRETE